MSVSFTAEITAITGFQIRCYCDIVGETYGHHNDAWAAVREMQDNGVSLDGCTDEDCVIYGCTVETLTVGPEADEINVSSFNARPILEALGYIADGDNSDDGMVGSATAEEFMGRVLLALAVLPVSAERLSETTGGNGTVTVHYGGRPEGYVQDRLAQLHGLAQFAREHSRMVYWG